MSKTMVFHPRSTHRREPVPRPLQQHPQPSPPLLPTAPFPPTVTSSTLLYQATSAQALPASTTSHWPPSTLGTPMLVAPATTSGSRNTCASAVSVPRRRRRRQHPGPPLPPAPASPRLLLTAHCQPTATGSTLSYRATSARALLHNTTSHLPSSMPGTPTLEARATTSG